jgi:tetratricopeptide (TPR) repeat protein
MKLPLAALALLLRASQTNAFVAWSSSRILQKNPSFAMTDTTDFGSWIDVGGSTPEDRFGRRMEEGVELIVEGRFNQACESIKLTLEAFDETLVSPETRAEAMCHLGGALVGIGATEEALTYFTKALELDPTLEEVADVHNNIAVHSRISCFFLHLLKYVSPCPLPSLDYALSSLLLSPSQVAFESINLPKMAEHEYKDAIEVEPLRPEIHAHYADLIYKRGDIAGAVLELETAISLCQDLDAESKDLFLPGDSFARHSMPQQFM